MNARMLILTLAALSACNGGKDATDTDTDATSADDTDVASEDPCDACDENASCEGEGEDAECVCDEGYDGDGEDCDDIDECEEEEHDCDPSAVCVNDDGGFTCECPWGTDTEGDSEVCETVVDEALAACAALQGEHPSYTTIARDVALCGGTFDPTSLTTACNTGWHVCLESEWLARYPIRSSSDSDADVFATIGPLTSWGAAQSERCAGGTWQAGQPLNSATWGSSVCATAEDMGSAAYNPWNDGKFLFADDEVTILEGRDEEGDPNCCDWDHTFAPTEVVDEMAVYCCRDLDE